MLEFLFPFFLLFLMALPTTCGTQKCGGYHSYYAPTRNVTGAWPCRKPMTIVTERQELDDQMAKQRRKAVGLFWPLHLDPRPPSGMTFDEVTR